MEKLESIIVNNVYKEQQEPREQFKKGDIAKKHLLKYAKIIKELSSSYVENKKDDIAKKMLDADFVKAYALYYLPINFYKSKFLFSKIPDEVFQGKSTLKLLDYGCGPATGALSASSYFEEKKISLDITLYDKSSKMKSFGEKLLKNYTKNKVCVLDKFCDVEKQKYDIITIFNVINELSKEEQKNLSIKVGELLNENGVLIILEPALKNLARNLMVFRDNVLKVNLFSILYPCFHLSSCPMRRYKDDWCHGELQGLNSKLVKQIDDITGFNKHKIKYSSVIFYNNIEYQASFKEPHYRVVDIPRINDLGYALYLCGDCKLREWLYTRNDIKKCKKLKKIKFFDEVKRSEIDRRLF